MAGMRREGGHRRRSFGRRPALGAAVTLGLAAAVLVGTTGSAPGAPDLAVDQTCSVAGPVTQTGTPIVSGPMVDAVTGGPLTVPVSASASVDQQIQPGGTVTSIVTLRVDLAAKAQAVLADQVRPAVVASGYPQLAPGAWVVLTLDSATIRFPRPAGTTPSGTPASTSPTVGTSAAFAGQDVVVRLGTLSADTRLGTSSPTSVTVGWRETDGGAAAPRSLDLPPPALSFTTTLDVGVSFSGAPLVGGIHADWSCAPVDPPVPLATTKVDDAVPPSTVAPTLPPVGPPPVISPPTTAPPTTWPKAATPPTACTVPATSFDRYGGWAPISLEATGAFRTTRVDGRSWLVDPLGHPFFSQGINHVSYAGTEDRNGVAAYHDAAVARYGSEDAWAAAQVERFGRWGYNTAGAWSDETVTSRMPYALLVGFTPQNFSTGVMTDLWDPAWIADVQATADAVAASHGDDPNLVGYWTDNELHFGPDWRPVHLFDDYLRRPATSPGKQALVAFLQGRYATFAAFEADVQTDATSWADLAGPHTATGWSPTGGQATRNAWTGVVAEQYFSTTVGSMRRADPVHLQLGPRLLAQTTGTPVLEAAARWVDVTSFNDYTIDAALLPGLRKADPTYLTTDDGLAAQAAVVGTPILVSEWGFRAADAGLPNTWPPLFPTLATQDQRAGAYQQFVASLLANPAVVGQHFFEHSDEPAAGRFDGEDSNFGLLDLHDDPWAPVVQVSRWMHDCAYARLLPAPPTTPSSTTTTATTSSTTTAPLAPSTPTASDTPPAEPAGAVAGTSRFTG